MRRSAALIALLVLAGSGTASTGSSVGTGSAAPSAGAANPKGGDRVSSLPGTTLLLWPAGPPLFGALPGGGPGTTVLVDDLRSGRHWVERIPGIAPGDFPVPLLPVGRWLVYHAQAGVSAIADTLRGRPRVLGSATFFVPSAAPNRVWLVEQKRSSGLPVSVRSVSVREGWRGAPLRLPPATAGVVEGSDAGLLLVSRTGWLELWHPGRSPRRLGRLGGGLEGDGVASDARVVVYGSGCRNEEATTGFPRTPLGYRACATLRVVNVTTGARFSFPAPPGTLGWAPAGFGAETAIAPGDHLVAAEAVIPPARKGRIRLFVLRLFRRGALTPVPSSTARLSARTAWSVDGSWLFYQGPGGHLHGLHVASGATRSFPLRCCRYTAMVAIRHRSP